MSETTFDSWGARGRLSSRAGDVTLFRLDALEKAGLGAVSRLPYSVKVVLESVLRNLDGRLVHEEDVTRLAAWSAGAERREIPFLPARVLMQDFTGVPAVVDLAAMRSAMERLGGPPSRVNPVIPVDLVIDHSVQVDVFRSPGALEKNAEFEFRRNRERYEFLRWGAEAFRNFRVVPPATGIVHQVNLEYLASVVQTSSRDGETIAMPDSLVGTDSHTTMINGLGVVGWGVGGIEAEANMLGQPIFILTPRVVGMRLEGELPRGATATDLVLTVTQTLRAHGVVGKFVEFCGPGLASLSLADRATIANMAPEYGATMGFFPVDRETLRYLEGTGRGADLVDLVERYTKEQGLFHDAGTAYPEFTESVSLDLGTVVPSIAGPRRPQDRVALADARDAFRRELKETYRAEVDPARAEGVGRWADEGGPPSADPGADSTTGVKVVARHGIPVEIEGTTTHLDHGAVVIAAITSCTNTSNPSVMVGAGLLARKAAERGLEVPPYVKTSLAPGSRVVTRYLEKSGLDRDLEQLGFYTVGYGCTTCIGNSGPLPEPVAAAIRDHDLVAVSVLSGNRNFEGRINPLTKANYLASPPLVVAYALAGTMDIDFDSEPVGEGSDGRPVMLAEIWPGADEVADVVARTLGAAEFEAEYGNVFDGNEAWNAIRVPEGELYAWSDESTYIKEPSFFEELAEEPPAVEPLRGARILALLGDSVTTDHISPAGAIPMDSPAGLWLRERGVEPVDFNSFGSRRGNHEVMIRGTFGNIRLRNAMVPGVEGGFTKHFPSGDQLTIFDASRRYRDDGVPLVVLAGREYGTGSSRDWAAKGTLLLGVRAVIAVSYERIHRSNLVGMGVLPLQFRDGESASTHGLDGSETIDVPDLGSALSPGQSLAVRVTRTSGEAFAFETVVRLDSPVEVDYFSNGGILQTVLRGFLAE